MFDAAYPRPQLVRDAWQDLSGEWQFGYDDDDDGIAAGWYRSDAPLERTITVPYPPESKRSGIGDTSYHPVLWYRRDVAAPELGSGQRLLLHFGAVDYHATVWVDGALVGEHTGGHTPFSCDITDAASAARADAPGEEPGLLAVVVRAEDQPRDVGQPRGKQDWQREPHGIWYHRTSGIWQQVWLETVPATHVSELHWTPDIVGARVRAEVRLNRVPQRPLSLHVTLTKDGDVLAEHSVAVTERLTVTDVSVPVLRHQRGRREVVWSPNQPHLVDATVELREGGEVVDAVGSYLGLRSTTVDGGDFQLNGRPTYLRSVLAQGYWPESHLAAPDAEALRREVELVKELGFNAVRVHQKVEDPRFLYWCDRLGVMVWGEMPSALSFESGTVERLTNEWVEVLRRDRSHPCVVTWVPFNESWGIDDLATDPAQRSFADALYHLTKAIDPTRPVIGNDGWEHTQTDIWSLHDYAGTGRRLRKRYGSRAAVEHMLSKGRVSNRVVRLPGAPDRGQPVMLTEFGGVRFDAAGGTAQAKEGWGYTEVESSEALVKRVRDLVEAVLDSPGISGFCYTQLTDTEQEQNGLLTEGRAPKAPIAQLRKVFSRARGGPAPGDPEGGTAADGDSRAGPRPRQLSRRLSRG